jgi:hypothetical protein
MTDASVPTEGETMERWYIGSMNDGLFIINTPPRPSNDYPWHDRPDGPTMVLAVSGMSLVRVQEIVDAHNLCLAPEPTERIAFRDKVAAMRDVSGVVQDWKWGKITAEAAYEIIYGPPLTKRGDA